MSRHRTTKSTGANADISVSSLDVEDVGQSTPRASNGAKSTMSQRRSGRSRRMTAPDNTSDDLFLAMANDDSVGIESSVGAEARDTFETESPSFVQKYRSTSYNSSPLTRLHQSVREHPTTRVGSSPLYPPSVDNLRPHEPIRNNSQSSLPASYSRKLNVHKPSSPSDSYNSHISSRLNHDPRIIGDTAPNNHDQQVSSRPSSKLAFARYKAGQDAEFKRLGVGRSYSQSYADRADSVVSSSTVWEDLDEIKSRIRRIESSGGRRSSGVRASGLSSSGFTQDRPRTANTTSTSSNQRYFSPPTSRDAQTGNSAINRLLHSALAKAKTAVDPAVYSALEASANDAIELSKMVALNTGPPFDASSSKAGSGFSSEDYSYEKRLRRKADNLCRSITELCIALCEDETYQPTSPLLRSRLSARRNNSQDYTSKQANGYNNSSPLSYLEARKARVERAEGAYGHSNPLVERHRYGRNERQPFSSTTLNSTSAHTDDGSHSTGDHTTPRTLNRATISFEQNKNLNAVTAASASYNARFRNEDDNEDQDRTVRIPSRAMSEVQRSGSRRDPHQMSLEYTSKHPLPPALDRSDANAVTVPIDLSSSQSPQERRQRAKSTGKVEADIRAQSPQKSSLSRGLSSLLHYGTQRWHTPHSASSQKNSAPLAEGGVNSSNSQISSSSRGATESVDERINQSQRVQQKVASAGQLGNIRYRDSGGKTVTTAAVIQ